MQIKTFMMSLANWNLKMNKLPKEWLKEFSDIMRQKSVRDGVNTDIFKYRVEKLSPMIKSVLNEVGENIYGKTNFEINCQYGYIGFWKIRAKSASLCHPHTVQIKLVINLDKSFFEVQLGGSFLKPNPEKPIAIAFSESLEENDLWNAIYTAFQQFINEI